jgi:hypothetical protein
MTTYRYQTGQKMNIIVKAILLAVVCVVVPRLSAQTSNIIDLEKQLVGIDSNMAVLRTQQSELLAQIEHHNRQIHTLKKEGSTGYFQHQKLENLLKETLSLSRLAEQRELQLHALRRQRNSLTSQLLQAYDLEIDRLILLSQDGDLPVSGRRANIAQVNALRQQKTEILTRAETSQPAVNLITITIDATDTPAQIRQKGDLLLDQADKLRNQFAELSSQEKDLQNELDMRIRISDLVTDLAIFDPQEETLSSTSAAAAQDKTDQSTNPALETGSDFRADALTIDNLVVNPKDFDFTDLSANDLETVLDSLNQYQKRLQIQADSLAAQAKLFYQSAQEQK